MSDLDSVSIDRLSNLPDLVLYQILSSLSTKNAVATSLLSTKWKFRWTNISNLIFTDSRLAFSIKGNLKFSHYVNRVLLLLNNQCIHKFSLELYKYNEQYDVPTWIAAAVAKKLKVLVFSVTSPCASQYPQFKLSNSLYTSKTLEVLDLNGIRVHVPNVILLPNLKTLRLKSVIYESDTSFCKLMSGCSALETACIERGTYDCVVTFTISSSTLKNLTYTGYRSSSFPEELEYKLEINAPALEYFDLDDRLLKDFSVENLCSLNEANIYLYCGVDRTRFDYDHYSKGVAKLVEGVYNVKNLSLKGETIKALNHAGATLSFPKLSRLSAEAHCCKWNVLRNLFEDLNKLDFLSFEKINDHPINNHIRTTHVACWKKPEKVPIWLCSYLKTLSISGFEGHDNELAMVAYFLENAKVVETVSIYASVLYDVTPKYKLLQKVSKLRRGSEKCEITFC